MKNKKRTYVVVALLIAVITLGVGYAAATTLLEVVGNATVLQSDGVKLKMTNPTTSGNGQTGTTATVDSNDASKGTCTVILKNYGDSAVCTYTVSLDSSDATLSASSLAITAYEDSSYATAWSASSSDYFTITPTIGQTTLSGNGTTTASITVTLKKENTTGAAISQDFYVKVVGETQQS